MVTILPQLWQPAISHEFPSYLLRHKLRSGLHTFKKFLIGRCRRFNTFLGYKRLPPDFLLKLFSQLIYLIR